MILWWWAVLTFVIGLCFGAIFMAIIVVSREDDDSEFWAQGID